MKIIKRHALLCASLAIAVVHDRALAQQDRLSTTAIGQIINETLRVLIPPGDSLSRLPIAKRTAVFDRERTMAAFGRAADASPPSIATSTPVVLGSKAVLSDCDSWGTKACSQLGWRAYVWLEPLSITESTAVIRGYVSWAERPRATFVEGATPIGKGALTGFATEIHLARNANGEWRFVRKGTMIVGD